MKNSSFCMILIAKLTVVVGLRPHFLAFELMAILALRGDHEGDRVFQRTRFIAYCVVDVDEVLF